MIQHKYGEFSDMQFSEAKQYLRKRIFFLLLVAEDLETREKFPDVDLQLAHTSVLYKISGLNDLLFQPAEVVSALSLLEEADKLIKGKFDFATYRKLILEAGAEIDKICASPRKEADTNA